MTSVGGASKGRVAADELAVELSGGPGWMYDWDLGELGSPPLLGPELASVHQTKLELIEGPVREALEQAGEGATAIDLGCSEGWFAHRLLEWGAARVVAVDVRAQNIRRARLVRDHLGVPPERLELIEGDVFGLDLDPLGRFDVVLALGLIYHLEDPVGGLRRAHALTRGVCVIDTQLTRQAAPLLAGCGSTGEYREVMASCAAQLEEDAADNPIASAEGVVALVPNRAAVELLVRAAGFGRSRWLEPAEEHNEQYRARDRAVIALWRAPSREERATWLELPGVIGRIHPNDDILYPQDPLGLHYARAGRAAVRAISSALSEAGRTFADVDACLDLACGYGRVLRFLVEEMPAERITACDVAPEAVAYCSYEFGALPLLSDPEFEGVPFEAYDLVWVGSLVTHLDRRLFSKFTALLPRLLAPGGLLLVTTLGDYGIEDVSRYERRLAAHQGELEGAYRATGFAFVPYEGREDLGYAWHSSAVIREAVEEPFAGELSCRAALPRGWDQHQDIHVFQREPA